MTYYGFNQISIENLTYQEFQNQALDLPASLDASYRTEYDYVKSSFSPYADGLGGRNMGSNFMPQLLRELRVLDETKRLKLKLKLQEFARMAIDSGVHEKLKFEFNCWIQELNSI